MIDIVLLTYNRLNYLRQTIAAIIERTHHPYRLIVVDNASTDPEVKVYLEGQQQKGVISELIFNPANQLLRGWYSGLTKVRSQVFAISDPDIIVPQVQPCWLTRLVSLLEEFPRLTRVGLSLDPRDVPPCWTAKQAERLCFCTGPYFNRQQKLRMADIDTTIQLIRAEPFGQNGGFQPVELNMDFWKKMRGFGVSAAAQDLVARHLGWREYLEEPAYLREKTKTIHPYREATLLE